MSSEDKKINWAEACKILGCKKTHFYQLIKKGLLPAYRLHGASKGIWVFEKDCHAILERINKNI